jgi:hypothetical protein
VRSVRTAADADVVSFFGSLYFGLVYFVYIIRSFGGTYRDQYLPDISFFRIHNKYILTYKTTDDHDDHGIQTRIVSRFLLRLGQSTFTFFRAYLQLGAQLLVLTINQR